MAVVFVEGFDYYNGVNPQTATTVGSQIRWTAATGSMVAGRFGGQAWYLTNPNAVVSAVLPSTYTSGCVGFALYSTGGNTSTSYSLFGPSVGVVTGNLGGRPQFEINLNFTGQVEVRRGGSTLLATSTATITFNTWNYLEVAFTIDGTNGSVVVYLNNNPTPIINITGVNTKNQTGTGFSAICFSSFNGNTNTIDDVYVTDNTTRLGEQRVITSYPSSDVLTDFWSSSTSGAAPYTMIDETTCDADATYVSSNTANSRVVVGMPTLPVVPVNVNAVQLVGFARKDDTQLRQIALEYQNLAGAVSTGSTYSLATSYNYINNLMPQNPLTGTSWTATDINNMRIGARIVT